MWSTNSVSVYRIVCCLLYCACSLGLYYFVLGNIPPSFGSKVKYIQVVAIAKTEHVKQYGCNAILKPLVDDVKKLVSELHCFLLTLSFTCFVLKENGHTFFIDGTAKKKYGTVCAVPADNLAANLMGGFKKGSRAKRGCRPCLATETEMKTIFRESAFTVRTLDDHIEKCSKLEGALTRREFQELSWDQPCI